MKRSLAALTVVLLSVAVRPITADAACIEDEILDPAKAAESPKQQVVFTGLVEETSNSGRNARVRVEKVKKKKQASFPDVVAVRSGSEDPTIFTSADITFDVGGRYEFFPRNDSEPFVVDHCTATQKETKPGKFERHFGTGISGISSRPPSHGSSDSGGATSPMAGLLGSGAAVLFLGLVLRSRVGACPNKRRLLAPSMIAVATAVLLGAPAEAGHQLTISGQINNHWGRGSPSQATPGLRFQIGAPESAFMDPITRDAVNRWNQHTNHVDIAFFLDGPPSCNANTYKGFTICLGPNPLQCGSVPNAAGCATSTLEPGANHYAYVRIQINLAAIDDHPAAEQHVVCQEIGHGLGLAHLGDDRNSCMDEVPNGPNYHPFPEGPHAGHDDFDQINSMSNHTH
jgi:hypothetical protein